ncbi:zonadhesin-like [Homarus americanus]|uniref:zonadhesin-like n=1 Tax=Homarus americanus TaxID=6706 RepID=UPI001C477866|nr:zonadhesin-like [Homarus americanus]
MIPTTSHVTVLGVGLWLSVVGGAPTAVTPHRPPAPPTTTLSPPGSPYDPHQRWSEHSAYDNVRKLPCEASGGCPDESTVRRKHDVGTQDTHPQVSSSTSDVHTDETPSNVARTALNVASWVSGSDAIQGSHDTVTDPPSVVGTESSGLFTWSWIDDTAEAADALVREDQPQETTTVSHSNNQWTKLPGFGSPNIGKKETTNGELDHQLTDQEDDVDPSVIITPEGQGGHVTSVEDGEGYVGHPAGVGGHVPGADESEGPAPYVAESEGLSMKPDKGIHWIKLLPEDVPKTQENLPKTPEYPSHSPAQKPNLKTHHQPSLIPRDPTMADDSLLSSSAVQSTLLQQNHTSVIINPQRPSHLTDAVTGETPPVSVHQSSHIVNDATTQQTMTVLYDSLDSAIIEEMMSALTKPPPLVPHHLTSPETDQTTQATPTTTRNSTQGNTNDPIYETLPPSVFTTEAPSYTSRTTETPVRSSLYGHRTREPSALTGTNSRTPPPAVTVTSTPQVLPGQHRTEVTKAPSLYTWTEHTPGIMFFVPHEEHDKAEPSEDFPKSEQRLDDIVPDKLLVQSRPIVPVMGEKPQLSADGTKNKFYSNSEHFSSEKHRVTTPSPQMFIPAPEQISTMLEQLAEQHKIPNEIPRLEQMNNAHLFTTTERPSIKPGQLNLRADQTFNTHHEQQTHGQMEQLIKGPGQSSIWPEQTSSFNEQKFDPHEQTTVTHEQSTVWYEQTAKWPEQLIVWTEESTVNLIRVPEQQTKITEQPFYRPEQTTKRPEQPFYRPEQTTKRPEQTT